MSDINTCSSIATARGITGIAHNQWVFLSVVYENNNLFLYANGQLVQIDLAGNPGWIKPIPSKAGGLIIGTASHTVSSPASQHHYQGLIDEIQIYNRALSEEEINAIFNSDNGICKDITICHKPGTHAEKTLMIPIQALEAHLGHGDEIGSCE